MHTRVLLLLVDGWRAGKETSAKRIFSSNGVSAIYSQKGSGGGGGGLAVELFNVPRQRLRCFENVVAIRADQFRLGRRERVQRAREAEQVLRLGQHVGLQFRFNAIEIVHLVLFFVGYGRFVKGIEKIDYTDCLHLHRTNPNRKASQNVKSMLHEYTCLLICLAKRLAKVRPQYRRN